MNTARLCWLSALALSTTLCHAQTAADPYRDEAYVFEKVDTAVKVAADGTGETLSHVVLRVQSEGTARQFSVLAVSYASANETGAIDYVRVHKKDGSTVETPTTDAIEMPSEVTREAPVYSDIREKHLPVRSLSVGDTLEYQFRVTRTKPEAPNQAWGMQHFTTNGGVILSQTLTLQAPAGMYLQVWSPNHPATPITANSIKTWEWSTSQPKPSAKDENGKMTPAIVKDPDENAGGDKLPSVAWTTFHTWAEVGDWYRGLALPRAEPTDAIKAKAAELTKDAKTPEQQVQALYRFVAMDTRYVGISFGVGRYQPHAAADVLIYQYGDCKDKDTLLESLLKAKGFSTAPALIGAGIAAVPDVPTPAVFNHAITTVDLPSGRIWLDSTQEVAPYRMLLPVLRDVNALVVPPSAPASLVKTPADPPFPYKEVLNATGTLDKDGLLKAHMNLTVRSDAELGVRAMLRNISPAQWDQAMQYLSGAMGYGGKVSNTDMRQPDPSAPATLSWDYTRAEYADWKNGNILPMFRSLDITTVEKEKEPEHDIDLGAPRTLETHSIITLPEGYRAELPEAQHVKRDYTTYDQTYRLADGKLYTDRTVVILKHKLPKAQWRDYYAFTHTIGIDTGETYIHLIAPAGKASVTPDVHAKEADPLQGMDETSKQLMADAVSAEKRSDFIEAKRVLEKVRQRDANTPYLMSMLGVLAARNGKIDEAITDLETELKNHPDDISPIPAALAAAYIQKKEYGKAESLLARYADRNDPALMTVMAHLQAEQGRHADAASTLDALLKVHPDDRNVEYSLANELYKAKRLDEAAAHAHHSMEGSDNANLINNNVYLLSEMKRDLPFAEENSRHSIAMLEKATSETSVDSANNKTFADSSNMTASWDTLAYILLLEGKPQDALPWFRAAWLNRPEVTVGNHLGQVYEALHQPGNALSVYRLALTTEGAAAAKEDYEAAETAQQHLSKSGISPANESPGSIQALRTHHMKRLANLSGSGTVRVVIANGAITEAALVSGDSTLKPALDEVKGIQLPGYTPPGSSGHVFRDAVLYCGKTGPVCDLVFMLSNGLAAESDAR